MWRTFLLLPWLSFTAVAQDLTPAELKLDLGADLTLNLMLVKPGTFQQGAPLSESGREDDETQRQVTISRAFYMGQYPVTRGQFAAFVKATRYKTEAEQGQSGGYGVENGKLVQRPDYNWRHPGFDQTDDHPVVLVTAQDAKAFCKWLSKISGRDCALPSEAQWEYACRAGTTGPVYQEPLELVAWYRGNSDGQTYPVGQKKPNAWGLYDFYGPVWQWCSDWYAPYPNGPITDPLQTDPNLSDKPRQVLRGGSFISDVSHSRSAERYRNDTRSRNADNGFRIVGSTTVRPIPLPSAGNVESSSTWTPTNPSEDDFDSGSSGSSSGGFFSWIIFPILAFIGYRVMKAFFGNFGSGARSPLRSNLTPREAADLLGARPSPMAQKFAFRLTDSGFYITGPADAVGTQIQYVADIGGRVLTDDIFFSPGPDGQFIFTGVKPQSVSVRTTGGAAGTSAGMMSSSFEDEDRHRRSFGSSSSSSRSYPSAY